MSKRITKRLTAALLVAACSTALGVENTNQLPAATNELLRMYPGSAVHKEQDRVRIIYGVPMTPGLNARGAADSFIQMHGDAFGCGTLSVQHDWDADFADGSKTVFIYQQYLAGLPVEYGCLKVLVMNGAVPQVIYAAGTLAPTPGDAGFPAERLDGQTAVKLVRAMQPYRKLPSWSAPQKVVFQGNGDWTAPVVAWKFTGESPDPSDKLHKTFFVDASSGQLLHVRDEVLHTDVAGSIKGMGSPGLLPDVAYNSPTLINLSDMRASIAGGGSAYSDAAGLFNITHPGTTPVDVSAGVNGAGAGRWVNVIPITLGPAVTSTLVGVTPPGPANLVLNQTPSEGLTAQVNAFASTTATHNYMKTFAPALTRWDIQLTCNTGVSGTCNAFYTTTGGVPNINFYNAGGGCTNTAFTTVVSHEYGHYIVSRLGAGGSGLSQGGFGEGFGDVTAAMVWDNRITAQDWQGPGTYIRDPLTSNIQYPCTSEIHTCGMVVAGVWWRTRLNMGTAYGEPAGLNNTRQLQVNWALITTGGPTGTDSAGPGTAIEVLTTDDNDGNINNGTPNYTRICPAFAAHSISCPVIQPLVFQYPAGHPSQVVPNQPANFAVNVLADSGIPQPGTGSITYRVNGGSYTTVAMAQGAPNQYTATLPAAACGSSLDYYLSAQTTTSVVSTDPPTAPASVFRAYSAVTLPTTFTDAFSTDLGWSGVAPGDTATTGRWTRNISQATAAQPGGDHTTGAGQCWVTDYRAGANLGDFDVDNGQTTLTSPLLDMSTTPDSIVGYWRWYSNNTGGAPNTDVFTVDISNNDGATWVNAETVGPAGAGTSGGWIYHEFSVSSLLAPTANMRVRFIASDLGTGSLVEAAVDDFAVHGITCAPACYANCDASTTLPVLNVLDFTCFLNRFAAGDTYANCDASTTAPVLNVLDFSCFLNTFAAGCP